MTKKPQAMGIDLADFTPSTTLAPATRIDNSILVSGHVSTGYVGKLGRDLDVETGKQAARVCAIDLLKAAYAINGTINNLRVRKLLGAVNSMPEFTDQHLVINGASELFWELYEASCTPAALWVLRRCPMDSRSKLKPFSR